MDAPQHYAQRQGGLMIAPMAYDTRPAGPASAPTLTLTIDVEGTSVRCFEMADGTRIWLCDCSEFTERAAKYPEGFCSHTAVAIMRCSEDGSIDVRF